MGRENELGTIQTGKLADLVLLNANPLDDIANTRKIDAVVYGGHVFPKSLTRRNAGQGPYAGE